MSVAWPFGELKSFHYGAILADPPWFYENRSPKGMTKNAAMHYPCMPTKEICALPVGHLANRDCGLFMWATAPMLPDALRVMSAWGFRFVTSGAWAKQSSTGKKWAFGTGYVLRSAAEFFLIGANGEPKVRSNRVRNLIVAPIREHSRKPESTRDTVEELFAGPYLELFARSPRAGWDCWGNETNKFQVAA